MTGTDHLKSFASSVLNGCFSRNLPFVHPVRCKIAGAELESLRSIRQFVSDPCRNLVERLFSKLKNWRRVATRYDKTKESYLGFVSLASALL
nr:transposase [Sphingomonas solaris]